MRKRDLFDLIKTLSPFEQKAVEKHAFPYRKKGDNLLYQLYKTLQSQEAYNETALKKFHNLSNRKRELWEKIMLTLLITESSIQQVLQRRKLDYAHILINRQLFFQAEQLSKEVKAWSDETEQPYIKGLAMQYLSAVLEMTHNGDIHVHSQRLRTELLDNAEKLVVANKAYDFYMRVNQIDYNSNFIRDPAVYSKAAGFMHDEAIDLPVSQMSLMAALMYLDAKCTVYYVQRKYKEALAVDSEAEALMAKYPATSAAHQTAYRNFLINRLTLLDQTGKFDKYKKSLEQYKKTIDIHFKNDLLSLVPYNVFNLWYYYRTNQLHASHPVLIASEAFFDKHFTMELARSFVFLQWDFIIIYFHLGNYDKAWNHCSALINAKGVNTLGDVTEFMRLFYLFILFEKRDWTYLISRIKQYDKFLRNKNKAHYKFDMACVTFFKQVLKVRTRRNEVKACYKVFCNALMQLKRTGDAYTCDVLRAFDFINWATKKYSLP